MHERSIKTSTKPEQRPRRDGSVTSKHHHSIEKKTMACTQHVRRSLLLEWRHDKTVVGCYICSTCSEFDVLDVLVAPVLLGPSTAWQLQPNIRASTIYALITTELSISVGRPKRCCVFAQLRNFIAFPDSCSFSRLSSCIAQQRFIFVFSLFAKFQPKFCLTKRFLIPASLVYNRYSWSCM